MWCLKNEVLKDKKQGILVPQKKRQKTLPFPISDKFEI